MISPAKILLLALLATAFVAYFGEKFTALTGEVISRRTQASGNGPRYAQSNWANGGDVYIPMSRDGHYWATLEVNGTPVRFVVDTGASHISLSYEDAAQAGLDPAALTYDRVFKTAGGVSRKAMVTLDSLSLESIEISHITASVSQRGQMNISLLGMNFLSKLSGFNVENNQMILKP
ncbi:MAG: hypothetical protein COB49_10225 [Alphaproteobacteria bacterium]|nr:MAG: hypothetical protein COB49_10225 [Alphaproteobacteria bacterium]